MRVAILGQFPLDLTRLGGVEVAIVYLLDSLPAAGVDEVHVLTCVSGLSEERTATVRGATIHYLPRDDLGRLTWHLREVRRMQAVLRAIRPDIVDAHGTRMYGGAALGSGFPNVITVHGIVAREVALYRTWGWRVRGWVDVLYERWCLAQAKDLIAISPYAEDAFRPLTKARFHLVENPVDLAFFHLERRPQPGRILFAGPIAERKGLVYLFQALARVKSAGALGGVSGGSVASARRKFKIHLHMQNTSRGAL